MKKSLKNVLAATISFSILLITGSTAAAEPIAPLSKYSEDGIKLIRQQNKTMADVKQEIPSKKTVGIPVYPGATYASSIKSSGLPPSINLISSAPTEKVKQWYQENLKGWKFSENLNLFYEGQKEPALAELLEGKYQTVAVMEESGKAFDLMFLDVPDVKTRIQILYKPKK